MCYRRPPFLRATNFANGAEKAVYEKMTLVVRATTLHNKHELAIVRGTCLTTQEDSFINSLRKDSAVTEFWNQEIA